MTMYIVQVHILENCSVGLSKYRCSLQYLYWNAGLFWKNGVLYCWNAALLLEYCFTVGMLLYCWNAALLLECCFTVGMLCCIGGMLLYCWNAVLYLWNVVVYCWNTVLY